ncbi:MAG: hypothetical protein GY804_03010 [Alphaproteobacteria bacterium]|nr:hypothetical protein [Alphaproteobacteria bacterium]
MGIYRETKKRLQLIENKLKKQARLELIKKICIRHDRERQNHQFELRLGER